MREALNIVAIPGAKEPVCIIELECVLCDGSNELLHRYALMTAVCHGDFQVIACHLPWASWVVTAVCPFGVGVRSPLCTVVVDHAALRPNDLIVVRPEL